MIHPFEMSSVLRPLRALPVVVGLAFFAPASNAVPTPLVDVVDPATKPLLLGPSPPFTFIHSILDQGFVPSRDTILRVPPAGPQLLPSLEILLDDDPLGPSASDPVPEQAIILTDFDLSAPFLVPLATNATGTYGITVDPTKLVDGILAVTIDLVPEVLPTSPPVINDLFFISSTLTLVADISTSVPEPAPLGGLALGITLLAASSRRVRGLRAAMMPNPATGSRRTG